MRKLYTTPWQAMWKWNST